MANSRMDGILCQLRRAAMPYDGGLTDAQLLEQFLAEREPAAFEALLHRHGHMVIGTSI